MQMAEEGEKEQLRQHNQGLDAASEQQYKASEAHRKTMKEEGAKDQAEEKEQDMKAQMVANEESSKKEMFHDEANQKHSESTSKSTTGQISSADEADRKKGEGAEKKQLFDEEQEKRDKKDLKATAKKEVFDVVTIWCFSSCSEIRNL